MCLNYHEEQTQGYEGSLVYTRFLAPWKHDVFRGDVLSRGQRANCILGVTATWTSAFDFF